MKNLVLALLLLGLVASGCSAPKGLSVARTKKDLVIRGVDNLENYNPALKVLATDTLFVDGPPDDSQITLLKKKKNGEYILPGGAEKTTLPKYIFQVKDGVFNPEDYLWAAGVTSDYKIKTFMDDELRAFAGNGKRSRKSTATKGEPRADASDNTFDVFGSEIKVVPLNDKSTAYYEPAKLSFMFGDNIGADRLILFSYNNQDMTVIDLNDQEMVKQISPRVKAIEIDLKYGDKFTFVDNDGRFPNISPKLVADRRFVLSGVKLAKNESGSEPFYLFQVVGGKGSAGLKNSTDDYGDGDTYNNEDNNDCGDGLAAGTCGAYYKLKLPPARQAKDVNYPNGFIRLDCCDLFRTDKALFLRLLGTGAIGYAKSEGRNQSTVRVDPSWLKNLSSKTYNRYKDRITR